MRNFSGPLKLGYKTYAKLFALNTHPQEANRRACDATEHWPFEAKSSLKMRNEISFALMRGFPPPELNGYGVLYECLFLIKRTRGIYLILDFNNIAG